MGTSLYSFVKFRDINMTIHLRKAFYVKEAISLLSYHLVWIVRIYEQHDALLQAMTT